MPQVGPLVWSTVQAEFQPHESTIDSAFVKTRLHIESRDGLPLHLREGSLRSGIVTTGSQSCQSLVWVPIHRVWWWVKVEWLRVCHPVLDAWSQPSILKPINYSEPRVGSAGATFFSPKYKAEVPTPATAQITCFLVVQTYWLVFPQDTTPQKVS